MGWLTVTIVFLSDASARPFGTKKVPNSIKQIMPVNILRYMVKSPFLEIRAAKFITSRNLVREIEGHSGCQTASKTTARKERHFNDLSRLRIFRKRLIRGPESVQWQQCQNCGANLQVSV